MNISIRELEQVIEQDAGVSTAIEHDGNRIVLTGMAMTEGEHEAALEIARSFLEASEALVDNIEVTTYLPEAMPGLDVSAAEAAGFPSAMPGTEDDEAIEPGDFTDQDLLDSPLNAAGPTGVAADTEVSEGDEVWVPPTDPPSDGAEEFIGGFQATAMDDDDGPAAYSTSGGSPDEAILEAVQTELRQDAATTNLNIEVQVRGGIVMLRGTVDDYLDVENAEAVAGRVNGVRSVLEQLRVRLG